MSSDIAVNGQLHLAKHDSIRFCVDYRKLNALTVRDVFPIPRTDDCLDSLGGARYFTCQFWQIPIEGVYKKYTAFTTPMTLRIQLLTLAMHRHHIKGL